MSEAGGRTQATGTRASRAISPSVPPRTHPKVLMKPLTEPSAYRETMSPMWRKLDISLMAAALGGAEAAGGPKGARLGSAWRTEKTSGAGSGASPPRGRELRAAGAGWRPPERKAARRGREPAVASG